MIYVTPVGPYFKGGMRAIELLISDEFHHFAWRIWWRQSDWELCARHDAKQIAKAQAMPKSSIRREDQYLHRRGWCCELLHQGQVLHTPELTEPSCLESPETIIALLVTWATKSLRSRC